MACITIQHTYKMLSCKQPKLIEYRIYTDITNRKGPRIDNPHDWSNLMFSCSLNSN